jgi:hypothetical protein
MAAAGHLPTQGGKGCITGFSIEPASFRLHRPRRAEHTLRLQYDVGAHRFVLNQTFCILSAHRKDMVAVLQFPFRTGDAYGFYSRHGAAAKEK